MPPRGAPPAPPPIITLLTDFGTRDGFAGTMKGVILARLPTARLVDLTHELEPGDVVGGALLLRSAAAYFPPGTVHLAVVDPGVGGPRLPLVLASGEHRFVGPDNGLLWPAAEAAGEPAAFELRAPRFRLPSLSPTFHGRDVFAPAAAALAAGEPPASMGPGVPQPHRLRFPAAVAGAGRVVGEVLWLDRFGNAITNLEPEVVRRAVGERFRLRAGSAAIDGPSSHYGAVPVGAPLVVLGSMGYYEVAVHRGSAAAALGLARGAVVEVEAPE